MDNPRRWSKEKQNAVLHYMNLRIKGIDVALSNEEIEILRKISKKHWKSIEKAIVELGGKPSVKKPSKPWRIA